MQLKIATASGVVALTLSINSAKAQTVTHNGPFVQPPRPENPLREPFKFENTTYPAVVDIDSDGDFDIVVGDQAYDYYPYYGTMTPLRLLLNVGTQQNPAYEEKFGEDNPFTELNIVSYRRGPVFADIDNDSDMDLFVGLDDYYGARIVYFRNDDGVYSEQTTPWDPVAKTGNPFFGLPLNYNAKLAFADIDKDDDLDAIVSSTFIDQATGAQHYLNYYKNDGQGTFTEANSELTFDTPPTNSYLNPVLADVDKDGDIDLVLGGSYMGIHYYEQVAPGQFAQQTTAFDPVLQTGNPFFDVFSPSTQPAFVDLDDDSDVDLLVGGANGDFSYAYPNTIIRYFENGGNSVYTEKYDLDNPLSGVDVRRESAPLLVDFDADGDLDALIGNKYNDYFNAYNGLVEYEFKDGKFQRVQYKDGEEGPFSGVSLRGRSRPFTADLDADGDLDIISGDSYGSVRLFRNDDGVYTEVLDPSPFDNLFLGGRITAQPGDMDGDGDLDLVVASNFASKIQYFENIGTPQVPAFEERVGAENPFDIVGTVNGLTGNFHLSDVDHDGDLDLLSTEPFEFKYAFNHIYYYENIGTPKAPVLELAAEQPFFPNQEDPFVTFGNAPQPYLADQDQDGDLDLFAGVYRGFVVYVENKNPAVVSAVSSTALNFRVSTDEEIIVDPTLTLSDEDDDLIVQATVTIANFAEGDDLHFIQQGPVSGAFDASSGVLTLKGKATRSQYQSILRTISYHYHTPEGGRKRPGKNSTVAKSIEFRVYDTDFTNPQIASRNLNVIFNAPPLLGAASETTQVGRTVTINLTDLMSDPDGNLDPSTLKIIQPPSSGATAVIGAGNNLIIDYDGVNFSGVDNITIEVCDDLGECTQNIITIDVESSGIVEVFNAIAPNSTGDNRFMRIHNLPESNRVTIFSRWGDKVFEMQDYDSGASGKRFEGKNNDGKALPTGTYFYVIEIPGQSEITGYLTLKQ